MNNKAEKSEARSSLRSNIFNSKNKQQAVREIEMFGEVVEVRQPTLGQIARMGKEDSKIPAIIRMMVEYVYVPGTNERVFDAADAEQLATMPSGKWLTDMNKAIMEMTGVDVKEAEKNSEETD